MGIFGRSKLASDAEVVDLLRTMHGRMGRLEADMEKLASGHQSLRGFVYAKLRKALAADEDVPDGEEPPAGAARSEPQKATGAMSREELRRTLVTSGRFIPGRPPRHD